MIRQRNKQKPKVLNYILNTYILFPDTPHANLISSCKILVMPYNWPRFLDYLLCTWSWIDPEKHFPKHINRKPKFVYKRNEMWVSNVLEIINMALWDLCYFIQHVKNVNVAGIYYHPISQLEVLGQSDFKKASPLSKYII